MLAGQRVPAGISHSTVLPDFDFEAFSAAGYYFCPTAERFIGMAATDNGLPVVGAAVYSEHPSTEILSLTYDLKDGKGPRLWIPGMLPPFELFEHLKRGGLLEAWNSGFESLLWKNICHKRMGWPALPEAQLRCAQSKSQAHGWPMALDKAAQASGAGEQKDKRGKQLINLLCKPRKPTKKDPSHRSNDPALLGELYAYNVQDIKAEAAVSLLTPDLSPEELEVWQLDQKINQLGVYIDKVALDNCISIVKQAFDQYNAELRSLTAGSGIQAASELEQIKTWLATQGLVTKSLDADHVEALLKRTDLPPHIYRVIEIRSLIGAASVKKLFAIDRMLPNDQRLKGLFAFCAAITGRFSGKGPQPQNLPNSGLDVLCCPCGHYYWSGLVNCPACEGFCCWGSSKDWGVEAVESCLKDIATRNLDWVESQWGDAVAAVASCLRGLFCAAPGHDLICSDFSAIEAVVMAFMAGEQWRMDVFHTHGKIYEMGASKITGVSFEEMMAAAGYHDLTVPDWWKAPQTGPHHGHRKKIGKVSELASGFGGGLGSWKNFGADKFMSDDEIKSAVKVWRKTSPKIAGYGNRGVSMGLPPSPNRPGYRDEELGFWYGLQGAAYKAIRNPGQCYSFRGITYGMKLGVLYARLPSGRSLKYHDAKLVPSFTPWGDPTEEMVYMGWSSEQHRWTSMTSYGPKLAENVVQAIARDILVFAMVNLDKAGYNIVLHVHDEIVAEVLKGFGSIEEFERIMSTMPHWAPWPIKATGGWRGLRYRKD